MEVLLLVQVPLPASVSITVAPAHTVEGPEMANGNGLTVTFRVAKHPNALKYVTTVVPTATPVTVPVPVPTEAVEGSRLTHEPPGVTSLSVVVPPKHTLAVPVMAAGDGFTVNGT
jgi:hypothetical protein